MGEWEGYAVKPRFRAELLRRARESRKEPTLSEHLLWQALRRRQLGGVKFRRQQPIGPFIVDFYAPQFALAIEVDGGVHEDQRAEDRERDRQLALLGVNVVRFPANDVETRIELVISQLDDVIHQLRPVRGPSPRQHVPESDGLLSGPPRPRDESQ